ncbi:flagellar hook-basal body protein FleE [Ameyamaea chiangmaiensis NBRC 103196]|uniref:Flagellar hook-basal body complex protein FliE n=1 Tax=Ameyamaea chiangmaiensis TaxID=442969 RepID=A0A850P8H1_9PROT|nr:flagellar hook-basal body complex protein FliE [Ameyamaea chiangmaiensis]MBS4075664.1 flagellar hook-basal body complex protein FliE [Ameyamaea chiangmaiensis]NVN40915.1 flagellar hook-basal body complex protein FliE [Ameyamaea chiangmaiensis]GBQ70601.1 flagellar hook-basal body protein FleE [Ameyamaea chiangmaiensis NBRC 103196]
MNVASVAAGAYARTQSLGLDTDGSSSGTDAVDNFGSVLNSAVQGAIDQGHTADRLTAQGLSGGGDVTSIITAVSRAQLALQTTTTIRDRVVQAYQDIMKMSI